MTTNTPPRPRLTGDCWLVNVETDHRKPFLMGELVRWFGKEISWVLNARDMVNIDSTRIDTIAYEVLTEINVFHAGMGMGVMGTCNSSLIVTIKNGGILLGKAKLIEEGTKPDNLAGAMSA